MSKMFVGSLGFALLAVTALSGCGKQKCETCADDSECASGMICHPEAKVCKPKGDKPACPAECKAWPKCKELALCTLKGDKCVVGDTDCTESDHCTEFGRCVRKDLGDYGTCVAINDSDCKKATVCADKGYCQVERTSRECRARSDIDCEQSLVCTTHKKCKVDKKKFECVAPPPPAASASAAPAEAAPAE